MTAQMPMAAHLRMAVLSELLPDTAPARRRPAWFARLVRLVPFRRRRPCGLAAIPERYRLQFLMLADAAMPGRTEADVAAMADALADRIRIPGRLLAQLPDTTGLDRWFREQAEPIKATLNDLIEGAA